MPAPKTEQMLIEIPKAWPAREAASFFAQLDDLSGRMFAALRGITTAELAWQAAPGMNTIGMLLAHCAIVEVFWLMVATGTYTQPALEKVLGIGEWDDGMPLAPGKRPPAALRGRSLAWYRKLHDKARTYAKRTARRMSARDLEHRVTRTRMNGTRSTTNNRWILYHVLEHQAGHYGQMLLLRHLKRDAKRGRR